MASRSCCTFGILGDSYSTYQGYSPAEYECYYPNEAVPDVVRVEDTWWHILMTAQGMKLLVNDSYSGSTVCTNTRDGQPFSSAFTERARKVFPGVEQPDYIFVFGGTNDSWLDRTIGQVQFTGRTEEDLQSILPAYCQVLETLKTQNPRTTPVAVINTELHPDIAPGIRQAAEHYGCPVVELQNIDKYNSHPTALGMRQIAEQIAAVLF